MAQTAQGPQSGLAVRRISATPGHSLERGPDGAPAPRTGPEYAKLIDISRCIGCKGCEVACKEWNELGVEPTENFGSMQSHRDLGPDTWLLMRFNEIEVADDLQWLIKKDACLHCEEPGCLYACPAPGAIVQYENGIVDFNQEQCIGCQLCVSGCPFDIPRFNPDTKKVYKCNMCIDRVEAGLEPACVKTCPTNAISWGTKDDMVALGAKKVEGLQGRGFENATLYDPAGVGGTHMMYVVPHGDQLDEYDLPADPTAAPGALAPWEASGSSAPPRSASDSWPRRSTTWGSGPRSLSRRGFRRGPEQERPAVEPVRPAVGSPMPTREPARPTVEPTFERSRRTPALQLRRAGHPLGGRALLRVSPFHGVGLFSPTTLLDHQPRRWWIDRSGPSPVDGRSFHRVHGDHVPHVGPGDGDPGPGPGLAEGREALCGTRQGQRPSGG